MSLPYLICSWSNSISKLCVTDVDNDAARATDSMDFGCCAQTPRTLFTVTCELPLLLTSHKFACYEIETYTSFACDRYVTISLWVKMRHMAHVTNVTGIVTTQ